MGWEKYVDSERWKRQPLWKKIVFFVYIFAISLIAKLHALAPLRPWLMLVLLVSLGGLAVWFMIKTGPEGRRRKVAMERHLQQMTMLEPEKSSERNDG